MGFLLEILRLRVAHWYPFIGDVERFLDGGRPAGSDGLMRRRFAVAVGAAMIAVAKRNG